MALAAECYLSGTCGLETPSSPGAASTPSMFKPPPTSPSASNYNAEKSYENLFYDVAMVTTPTGSAKRKRGLGRDSPLGRGAGIDDDYFGKTAAGHPRKHQLFGRVGALELSSIELSTQGALPDSADRRNRFETSPQGAKEESDSPDQLVANIRMTGQEAITPVSAGWTTFALNTLGGVMGKVWEFCKGGAFRGFKAGGGKSYELPGEAEMKNASMADAPTLLKHTIQGGFPQTEYVSYSDFDEMSTPEYSPQPPAKRRQIGNHEEFRCSWGTVDKSRYQNVGELGRCSSVPQDRRVSSTRQEFVQNIPLASSSPTPLLTNKPRINATPSRPSTASSAYARQPSLRNSYAEPPTAMFRQPASYAAPRFQSAFTPAPMAFNLSRIPVPVQSPTAGSRPASRRSSFVPMSSSQGGNAQRRNTSTVSGASVRISFETSPRLDTEARQLAQRKLAAESDTDMRVDQFNARLTEMIRQGKEALGTKVEVEYAGEGRSRELKEDDDESILTWTNGRTGV